MIGYKYPNVAIYCPKTIGMNRPILFTYHLFCYVLSRRVGAALKEHRPKVLILDEDSLSLELYSRDLCCDYQVISFNNTPDARHYMKEHALDVMVIEPAVNQGEGWSLLREIQSAPNPPLVILCSIDDDRRAGLRQGAYAFLVKPVLPSTLHVLIDRITARNTISTKGGK
jgi:DNA-binding response OmpR family regulator